MVSNTKSVKKPKAPIPSPEELLSSHSEPVQVVSQTLRRIVKNAIPSAEERVYPGWHGIGYRHPQAGYFCCIFPLADKVRFALEHGASLPDPDGLFIMPPTSGKQLRYIELKPGKPIPEDEIVAVLYAAIQLKA
jgi:hypothetical protein